MLPVPLASTSDPDAITKAAAGFDLAAAEATVIPAGGQAICAIRAILGANGLVKTGISIAIPEGTYARVAPRSGLAVKKMIHTGAGVVHHAHRGEVGVVLFNHGAEDFAVSVGDRVAQLILQQISLVDCQEVASLDETLRGAGGFGSTGVATTAVPKQEPEAPQPPVGRAGA
ncbi:Deoxyuridine 5'-triphosphate nucleotidohydrolase (dUTPase) (dUTP pyrophosphatase) [Durusdinium trenchii]|uniref:Deoxyuridine 5'-triphosphate nucleotidohydrolase n=1 Tax=Durusdinium trenchii TaxID=1381693 RepID=A0ABP0RBH8_9DINO